jgi:hypothetical protein
VAGRQTVGLDTDRDCDAAAGPAPSITFKDKVAHQVVDDLSAARVADPDCLSPLDVRANRGEEHDEGNADHCRNVGGTPNGHGSPPFQFSWDFSGSYANDVVAHVREEHDQGNTDHRGNADSTSDRHEDRPLCRFAKSTIDPAAEQLRGLDCGRVLDSNNR